ncbi:helix-turn-helix domain-containing protein [Paenibacillus sp. 481]|uniref:helix-turn-helix domain-containing protein n=1 Tax=Paenibacillus sp. 481 TaxID=2835869 RepID=UPI001E52D8D9|nr:helix-turn-helix transcriptional regulator [Paenibacillus sp. 481]UHA75530.1 helix-turn-helix transcriptional regulator [Paenibacillus sp. 481]
MLSQRMEQERLKRGWTQDDVASRISVSRSAYSNYENGNRKPDIDMVKEIARLYEVSIDYLTCNDAVLPTDNSLIVHDARMRLFFEEFMVSPLRQREELMRFWRFMREDFTDNKQQPQRTQPEE